MTIFNSYVKLPEGIMYAIISTLIFTVVHHYIDYIPQQKPNIAVEISKRETPGMFVGV